MNITKPEISVIIPTYNRLGYLKELVAGLQAQKNVSVCYEVIVVCDGCNDGTVEWLQQKQASWPVLRVVELQQGGPARARNMGARLAKGKWLLFTDDDCIPAPHWLQVVNECIENNPCMIGWEGATYTFPLFKNPLTHQIENAQGHPAVPTCNAAYQKQAFWQVGGFDESFPFAHNEDADLAWRIKEVGMIGFCENMTVYHPPRSVAFEKVARRMEVLKSEFLLYHKNKRLYQQHRGKSPWIVIYGQVFFVHQFRLLKSSFKYIKNPRLMMQGIALRLAWWVDLARLLPDFLAANRHYRKKFRQINTA